MPKLKQAFHLLLIFSSVVIFTILLRLFVVNIYRVPSNSMAPVVNTNAIILVSKISCGSRLPYWGQAGWQPTRLFSEPDIEREAIVVFNLPLNSSRQSIATGPVLVKRCIGLPGDSIVVRGTTEYVNTAYPSTIDAKEALAPNPRVMPYDTTFGWSSSFWGPVTVPRRGDTLQLTHRKLQIYRRVIETHEENTVTETDSTIYINGKATGTYIFKQNYYFMMGDNRRYSEDSRFWGFVPQSHIIGKVIFVF